MSHRRKKFLSAGLAGMLCSTALFGLTAAYADGKNNLHLPGMRDRPQSPDNSFTRMFPELPPFAPPTDAAREQARKLGEKGGLIDALDNLTDPIRSITEPLLFSPNNPDNPNMTAGVTFFGQFLDHDMTLDPRSPLLERSNPRKTTNFRTAAFDLDSVYGEWARRILGVVLPEFRRYQVARRTHSWFRTSLSQRSGPVRFAARCEQQRHHRR